MFWKTASQYTITVVCHSLTCFSLVCNDTWFLKLHYFDLLLLLEHRPPTVFCILLGPELSFHVVYMCSVLFLFFFSNSCPQVFLKMASLSFFDEGGCSSRIDGQWRWFCVWPSHLYLLCQITSTLFCCVLPHRFSFLMVSGQLSKRIETQTNAESAYLTYFTRHTFCWNKEIRYLH